MHCAHSHLVAHVHIIILVTKASHCWCLSKILLSKALVSTHKIVILIISYIWEIVRFIHIHSIEIIGKVIWFVVKSESACLILVVKWVLIVLSKTEIIVTGSSQKIIFLIVVPETTKRVVILHVVLIVSIKTVHTKVVCLKGIHFNYN